MLAGVREIANFFFRISVDYHQTPGWRPRGAKPGAGRIKTLSDTNTVWLQVFAPAKVNICLHVGPRRPDGMHPVATLMQPLSIGDTLRVKLGGEGLRLACNDSELEGPDNLVLKAARAWFAAANKPAAAGFFLEKHIPVAAGLGGGSSDAAAALMALNALNGGLLPPESLCGLAAGVGADVAFFLGGVTALCTGAGERVQPWPEFPLLNLVLINPGFAVSTAWVYGQFDLAWTNQSEDFKIAELQDNDQSWDSVLVNDLERVTMAAHPRLADTKKALISTGAQGALMSGSGPSVFGVFARWEEAQSAAEQLHGRGLGWVRACRGVSA